MSDYLSQMFAKRSLPTIKSFVAWVEARVPQYMEAGNDAQTSYQAAIEEGVEQIQALSDEFDAHEAAKYTPGKAVDGRVNSYSWRIAR